MRRACTFLVPGDWHSPTGGYAYDRRIAEGLRGRGWTVRVVSPGDGFPWPDAMAREAARQAVEALPDEGLVVADGLAFGVLPALARRHARRLRWVALVHHPLALETGLSARQQAQLRESEGQALAAARRVVATSASTAHALRGYGVEAGRIHVVMPGTDAAAPAPGGGAGAGALSLLVVATVTPRKGHRVLLEALAGLREHRWVLHCAGSLTRDPAAAAAARAAGRRLGLGARVHWWGEVDTQRLEALYAQADLFTLPSYHEGYGMAAAEALARGLPVIGCAAGAVADTVPGDAAALVPPGDAGALRAVLRRALEEPVWRAGLAAGARRAALGLPTWPGAVARFESVLLGALEAAP